MHFLQIEHLKKHFGNQVVLDDVNLEMEKGEIVCIIGESGGGKSVILKHIIGLMIPDGGQIHFEGKLICSPTFKQSEFAKMHRHFGMLFQGAALFDSMNVGENLRFPLREHRMYPENELDGIVEDALEKVGLRKEFQEKMPSELSGGMRSRVGLARAIVMKPDIMLYDEPTSALDPIRTDTINDLILSLREKLNMTSLIVTHDMGSAYRVADKIAMLYQGKIIFYGTPAEIRGTRNPYIQQFISGRRKLHYAITAEGEEKEALRQQVDLGSLRRRAEIADVPRKGGSAGAHDTFAGLTPPVLFNRQLGTAFQQARAAGGTFTVVRARIDYLDRITARWGDEFRATVMQGVASEMRSGIRAETDTAARSGAQEFVLILKAPSLKPALDTLERIRSSIAAQSFEAKDGESEMITMSFGVTLMRPDDATPDQMMQRAEQALQTAGEKGNNRVEVI